MSNCFVISNGLVSGQMTRAEISKQTGLTGKELTEYINGLKRSGDVICAMRHVDPCKTPKKIRVYVAVAHQSCIDLQAMAS